MPPEVTRARRAYRRLVVPHLHRMTTRYRLYRRGLSRHFDLDLKRRYLAGERFTAEEIERKYDLTWEKFVDDCVTGDDLTTIVEHLDPETRTVLEVGCGAGRVAIELARTGRQVTGVDISGRALQLAATAARDAGVEVEWIKAPMERLPFPDGSFDAVTTSHTLEHVQDLGVAVAELLRVARRQLLVIVPREDRIDPLTTDYHFQHFPDAAALECAIPLDDHVCFVARTDHEQWHGQYVFYAGRLTGAGPSGPPPRG